jgi:cytochrome c oxidase subunit 1
VRRSPRGTAFLGYLKTTDPKTLGIMYIVTALGFFLAGGLLALLMRAELARPGMQFLTPEQYNQLFTMHGTIMLLLYATPIVFGFANFVVPLQIGAPDVAFPRLNAFSYWLYLFGALITVSGFATPGGAAAFGWTAYAPLNSISNSPQVGGDLWDMGLVVAGIGTILGAVNMTTTITCLRCPGMTMWRLPVFTWEILATAILILVAFPVLSAALLGLEADRHFGSHVFDPANGGAILWQHLFWFFGHPEVYIVALPFFGIVTEIFPVFSRKPVFGYRGLVYATFGIAALSVAVWARHMFATGAVLLPFFSFMTFLIAIPTGLKFFNWIGTMWKGQLTFETPMLWACGFLVTFLFGGLTGVILAAPALDFHVSDTYFVVAHFHYVLFGTIVFATFGGIYFWFPKMTGRFLDERPAAFLDHLHRLPPHLPDPALARRDRHAPPLRRLPPHGRIHPLQHLVQHRGVPARRLHAAVPVERRPVPEVRRDHPGGRPLGIRQLPGMGHQQPTAPAQLPRPAPDPLRTPRVRTAPPRDDRTDAPAGPPGRPTDHSAEGSASALRQWINRHRRPRRHHRRSRGAPTTATSTAAPRYCTDKSLPIAGGFVRP